MEPSISRRTASGPWERGSRTTLFLVLLLVWSVPGLLNVVQERAWTLRVQEEPIPWARLLPRLLPSWWPWIPASLLVARLARRFPLREGAWRALAIHLPALVLLGLAHLAFAAWLQSSFPLREEAAAASFRQRFEFLLWTVGPLVELLAYAAVAATTEVLDSIRRVRDREVASNRLAAQLARAELGALRMQLEPHFLFNTLNSISVLLTDDPQAADRMLLRLADLLRETLGRAQRERVTLADEVDFVRSYLGIEEQRFPDRLEVDVDVEAGCGRALVPTMLLQPLVENAVRHGISPRARGGCIVLRARCQEGADGRLRITVEDDGVGPAPGWREGIGLANTRERLAHHFGEDASLAVEPREGGGTLVTLELPIEVTA